LLATYSAVRISGIILAQLPKVWQLLGKIVQISWKTRKSFARTAQSVLAVVLILQMVALLVLVACPALHHALHHDSNDSDHGCLVTLFAKGQLSEAELTPVFKFVAPFVACAVLLPSAELRAVFRYCFASSRAPPSF
jgi:hypothetical protein